MPKDPPILTAQQRLDNIRDQLLEMGRQHVLKQSCSEEEKGRLLRLLQIEVRNTMHLLEGNPDHPNKQAIFRNFLQDIKTELVPTVRQPIIKIKRFQLSESPTIINSSELKTDAKHHSKSTPKKSALKVKRSQADLAEAPAVVATRDILSAIAGLYDVAHQVILQNPRLKVHQEMTQLDEAMKEAANKRDIKVIILEREGEEIDIQRVLRLLYAIANTALATDNSRLKTAGNELVLQIHDIAKRAIESIPETRRSAGDICLLKDIDKFLNEHRRPVAPTSSQISTTTRVASDSNSQSTSSHQMLRKAFVMHSPRAQTTTSPTAEQKAAEDAARLLASVEAEDAVTTQRLPSTTTTRVAITTAEDAARLLASLEAEDDSDAKTEPVRKFTLK